MYEAFEQRVPLMLTVRAPLIERLHTDYKNTYESVFTTTTDPPCSSAPSAGPLLRCNHPVVRFKLISTHVRSPLTSRRCVLFLLNTG